MKEDLFFRYLERATSTENPECKIIAQLIFLSKIKNHKDFLQFKKDESEGGISEAEFLDICENGSTELKSEKALFEAMKNANIKIGDFYKSERIEKVLQFADIFDFAEKTDFANKKEMINELMKIYNDFLKEPIFQNAAERKKLNLKEDLFYSTLRKYAISGFSEFAKSLADVSMTVKNIERIYVRQKEIEKPNNKSNFDKATKELLKVYNFGDFDIKMLVYFVNQCRTKSVDNSMRMALYFSGEKQHTGKSTSAYAIAAAINGEMLKDKENPKFETNIQLEQGKGQSIPACCSFLVSVINEAFFDKKQYHVLKRFLETGTVYINPKFKAPFWRHVPKNYILTSNDRAGTFVDAETERRFLEINFDDPKKRITIPEVYAVWKNFVEAVPEIDLFDWHQNNIDKIQVEGIVAQELRELEMDLTEADFSNWINTRFNKLTSAHQIIDFLNVRNKFKDRRRAIDICTKLLTKRLGEGNNGRWYMSSRNISILTDAEFEEMNVDDAMPF